jgi:hypothetical protein
MPSSTPFFKDFGKNGKGKCVLGRVFPRCVAGACNGVFLSRSLRRRVFHKRLPKQLGADGRVYHCKECKLAHVFERVWCAAVWESRLFASTVDSTVARPTQDDVVTTQKTKINRNDVGELSGSINPKWAFKSLGAALSATIRKRFCRAPCARDARLTKCRRTRRLQTATRS